MALADDISIIIPNIYPSSLNTVILQNAINEVYDWTLYWRLAIKPIKSNTISITRRYNYKARVYNINGDNIDCVHNPSNAPVTCAHNPKYRDKCKDKLNVKKVIVIVIMKN